mgnify:CR=1 FL=1
MSAEPEVTTLDRILILIENHPFNLSQRQAIREALRHAAIKETCVRGHLRIAANLDGRKGCLPCKAEWKLEPCPNCQHGKGLHTGDGCRHKTDDRHDCDCISVKRQYVDDVSWQMRTGK